MKIVVDTTVIWQDRRLELPASVAFLEGLKLVPATLCVPEVVVDEAVNHFKRDLARARHGVLKAESDLARLLGKPMPHSLDVAVDARLVEDYRLHLIERIKAFDGEVLPYPKIEHKKIVERDLTTRRPFRDGGAGYRDTLIWESVRSLTWVGDERVVFVTGNTRDFGQGPRVHDDLLPDVVNPGRLRLYPSLAALNQELVLPKMQMLEGVRADLEANRAGAFDLVSWVRDRLLDVLRGQSDDLAGVVVGFPHGVGSAWPREIVELKQLRVPAVRALGDHQLLVRIEACLDASVSVSWDDNDYRASEAVRAWDGSSNAQDFDATTWVTESLEVWIDLVIDKAAGSVASEEVTYLRGPAGEADYGSSIE